VIEVALGQTGSGQSRTRSGLLGRFFPQKTSKEVHFGFKDPGFLGIAEFFQLPPPEMDSILLQKINSINPLG
jgi:hypothetical protein